MAKIMIVDDSKMVRRAMRFFLEAGNHEIVSEAADGQMAVKFFQESKPEIVTMDINMPVMDGIDSLKKIREIDPNAKVIMMSALNQKDKVLSSIQAGAINYILKPIKKDSLLKVIEEAIAKS